MPGPDNIETAALWPIDFWTALRMRFPIHAQALASRLRRTPVLFRSWYSGMDCPLMGLDLLDRALEQDGITGTSTVVNTQASDIGFMQREVLLSFPDTHRAEHIFGDICERVGPKIQQRLTAIEDEVLKKADELVANGTDKSMAQQMCGHMFIEKMWRVLESAPFHGDKECWCYKHHKYCRIYDDDTPNNGLTVAVAGVTCVDVCQAGARRMTLGPSFRPWMVWAFERRRQGEDIILQECAPSFPLALFKRVLEPTHEVHYNTLLPSDFGWPGSGARGWTLAIKRDKLCMHMPLGEAVSLFRQDVRMDGGAFFIAPDTEVQAMKDDLARRRRLPAGVSYHAPWEDIISPGFAERLSSFDDARRQLFERTEVKRDGCVAVVDKFLGNICWNAECRNNLNFLMPRLLTRSVIFNLKAEVRRPLVGAEHLLVQGVPVYGLWPGRSLIDSYLRYLTESDMRMLAGNGMCLPVVGRLLGIALAFATPRPSPREGRLPPSRPAVPSDSDDPDDDDHDSSDDGNIADQPGLAQR